MQPFDITQHDSLEDFMVDYHSPDSTHTVPSQWLQNKLRRLDAVELENAKMHKQEQANAQYLAVLQNRIDSLLLASEIQSIRKRTVNKYLDVNFIKGTTYETIKS